MKATPIIVFVGVLLISTHCYSHGFDGYAIGVYSDSRINSYAAYLAGEFKLRKNNHELDISLGYAFNSQALQSAFGLFLDYGYVFFSRDYKKIDIGFEFHFEIEYMLSSLWYALVQPLNSVELSPGLVFFVSTEVVEDLVLTCKAIVSWPVLIQSQIDSQLYFDRFGAMLQLVAMYSLADAVLLSFRAGFRFNIGSQPEFFPFFSLGLSYIF